jgi:zinc-ribbon domain
MDALCHRCGTTLSASDLFCPNCGAPQVRFEPQAEGESGYASARAIRPPHPTQSISWKDAVKAAILVAIPSGLLSAVSVLSWGCCLWVVGGSALAIALYRKWAPGFLLDTRSGFRIGALAGVIAAYTSVAATAVWRVFARFVLHQGADIDHAYDMAMQNVSATAAQSTPESQAQLRTLMHLLMSPNGRAGLILWSSVLSSLGIILFSALGGILGVRLFAMRKGPLSHS